MFLLMGPARVGGPTLRVHAFWGGRRGLPRKPGLATLAAPLHERSRGLVGGFTVRGNSREGLPSGGAYARSPVSASFPAPPAGRAIPRYPGTPAAAGTPGALQRERGHAHGRAVLDEALRSHCIC